MPDMSQLGTNLGSAPAAIPAAPVSSSSSSDSIQSFEAQMAQNASELSKAQQAASIPQAAGHSMQMPVSLMPQQRVAGQAPMNNNPVVGARNARARGIGNAITGVLNAVSSVGTELANQKSKKVADATEKLFGFQSSIDQASQIQKPVPDADGKVDAAETARYVQAQAQIGAAKKSMEGILSDKSVHSALEKASVIDHTDPKSQDTPEHKGFFQGKAAFEKKQAEAKAKQEEAAKARTAAGLPPASTTPRADNFGHSQPIQYGQNPNAVARVQQLQVQQKEGFDLFKAIIPAQIRADSALMAGAQRLAAEALKAKTESDDRWARIKEQEGFRLKTLGIEYQNSIKRISFETGEAAKREAARIKLVASDPQHINQSAQQSQSEDARLISSTQNQISAYQTQLLSGVASKALTPQQQNDLQNTINQLQERQDLQKTDQENHLVFWNGVKINRGMTPDVGGGKTNGGSGNQTNASASTSSPEPVINEADSISYGYLNNDPTQ